MKKKKDPVKHEQDYIEFLTKQLEWLNKHPNSKDEIIKVKYKLDKARLVLKILEKKK